MSKAAGVFSMPPYAYVPGRNPRHPEDWFDSIKADAEGETAVNALHQTTAWHAGVAFFHAGFFWECHEVLEAVWLRTPDPSPQRDMVQAIIQLANARLKLTMDRPRATARLCVMVRTHLARCPNEALILGIAVEEVLGWVAETEAELSEI